MWGSPIHFGTASETRCSLCTRSVTLELSKTDEQGQAVHELCYVQATLARLQGKAERSSLSRMATTPVIAIAATVGPELEGSFWKAFEFVRW